MKLRFAFAGFQHPHIFALLEAVKKHPACESVASCEPDGPTRDELASTQRPVPDGLTTAQILRISRIALQTQAAASAAT